MDSEFVLNLKEISLEIVIIALLVFGLTMLIKWPIKRVTAKFDDNKRKAINTVIVFIPMVLSLLFNALYFGIFKGQWFSTQAFDGMVSSYVLAVTIYAVFTRIIILVKGAKTKSSESSLSKETISYIKKNAKTLSKALKLDEQELEKIVSKVESLVKLRDEITSNIMLQDIPETENLEKQIKELNTQKNDILDKISKNQSELEKLQSSIKKEKN